MTMMVVRCRNVHFFRMFLCVSVVVVIFNVAALMVFPPVIRRVAELVRAKPVVRERVGEDSSSGPSTPASLPLDASPAAARASTARSVQVKAKVKVILVTYMRSGSSFAGDLFGHHPETFYVYEPLQGLQKLAQMKRPAAFFNGSQETVSLEPEKWFSPQSRTVSNVKAFLGCDFYQLDFFTLAQPHLHQSPTTKRYFRCVKKWPGLSGILRCLFLLFQSCRPANVSVVKTIRFNMAQAQKLLEEDPEMKVIHLVRDPRGTLGSRQEVPNFKDRKEMLNDFSAYSRSFCRRVLDDLEQARTTKARFPGRVLSIRYEDLATDPFRFARKLLDFAGLSMDDEYRAYLWNITSAGLPDNCAICTTRSDSRAAAEAWRSRVSFATGRTIDENCADVYSRVGYLPFRTEEGLKNLTLPAFVEPDQVPGLWTL